MKTVNYLILVFVFVSNFLIAELKQENNGLVHDHQFTVVRSQLKYIDDGVKNEIILNNGKIFYLSDHGEDLTGQILELTSEKAIPEKPGFSLFDYNSVVGEIQMISTSQNDHWAPTPELLKNKVKITAIQYEKLNGFNLFGYKIILSNGRQYAYYTTSATQWNFKPWAFEGDEWVLVNDRQAVALHNGDIIEGFQDPPHSGPYSWLYVAGRIPVVW